MKTDSSSLNYTTVMQDVGNVPHGHGPHVEGHFESTETVRDIVIGLSDGLTVPFALAAGLSGAVDSSHIIVLAGLAEIAAGSIAMGLGGYLAARGDAEHYVSERKREEREIVERTRDEEEEIFEIFEQYSVDRTSATPVLEALKRNPDAWVDFMMRFELGLEEPARNRAHRSALTIAGSYIAGGMVPLLPYFFVRQPTMAGVQAEAYAGSPYVIPDNATALKVSVGITLVALAVFGALKGRLVGTGWLRSSLQTITIGGAAAAAAYTLARLLSSHP
jgi:vacuolar iron transporter family protein